MEVSEISKARMEKMHILNAFSLNMLGEFPTSIKVASVDLDTARQLALTGQSAVGHSDTAAVFTQQLGVEVPAVRATVALKKGDEALVGQYSGPRLPEGATMLPEGATIKWLLVTIE